MKTIAATFASAVLVVLGLGGQARATEISVPVSHADTANWLRSDGGQGSSMPTGGPSVWNARFVVSVPAGASGISFKLDNFLGDDKAVVHLNGGFIADAVVTRPNGTAAGAGSFDFGLGAGNQPYVFVGYTPGTQFPLPVGTTTVTILVFLNDTGSADASAPPLPVTVTSGFAMTGTVRYDDGNIFKDGFEDNPPQ